MVACNMIGRFTKSNVGKPITHYQKRVCVPVGVQPEIGEIWHFEILGENKSGNILNIKCTKKVPDSLIKKIKNIMIVNGYNVYFDNNVIYCKMNEVDVFGYYDAIYDLVAKHPYLNVGGNVKMVTEYELLSGIQQEYANK